MLAPWQKWTSQELLSYIILLLAWGIIEQKDDAVQENTIDDAFVKLSFKDSKIDWSSSIDIEFFKDGKRVDNVPLQTQLTSTLRSEKLLQCLLDSFFEFYYKDYCKHNSVRINYSNSSTWAGSIGSLLKYQIRNRYYLPAMYPSKGEELQYYFSIFSFQLIFLTYLKCDSTDCKYDDPDFNNLCIFLKNELNNTNIDWKAKKKEVELMEQKFLNSTDAKLQEVIKVMKSIICFNEKWKSSSFPYFQNIRKFFSKDDQVEFKDKDTSSEDNSNIWLKRIFCFFVFFSHHYHASTLEEQNKMNELGRNILDAICRRLVGKDADLDKGIIPILKEEFSEALAGRDNAGKGIIPIIKDNLGNLLAGKDYNSQAGVIPNLQKGANNVVDKGIKTLHGGIESSDQVKKDSLFSKIASWNYWSNQKLGCFASCSLCNSIVFCRFGTFAGLYGICADSGIGFSLTQKHAAFLKYIGLWGIVIDVFNIGIEEYRLYWYKKVSVMFIIGSNWKNCHFYIAGISAIKKGDFDLGFSIGFIYINKY